MVAILIKEFRVFVRQDLLICYYNLENSQLQNNKATPNF